MNKEMPINSKDKGARFERELATILKEYGFLQARRTAQYCGNTGDASDVVGLPGYHIEAKHQEKMKLYDWIAQAVRDSQDTGNVPIVVHKQNRKPMLVSMLLDDFINLYNKAYPEVKNGS